MSIYFFANIMKRYYKTIIDDPEIDSLFVTPF